MPRKVALPIVLGIPKFRKEGHHERARNERDQFFHTFFYVESQVPFYIRENDRMFLRASGKWEGISWDDAFLEKRKRRGSRGKSSRRLCWIHLFEV